MPVFMSKKRRAEMRKRRKNTKHQDGGGTSASKDQDAAATRNGIHAAATGTTGSSPNKRKRADSDAAADEAAAAVDGNWQSTPRECIVRIPDGLSGKEARKFRKDARRKARAEGGKDDDDAPIVFVTADGTRIESSNVASAAAAAASASDEKEVKNSSTDDKDGDESEPPEKKKRRGRPPKSFPRINDLLAAHEEAKKKEKELSSRKTVPPEEQERYVALDCEMVGIGAGGKQSALARVSLTGWDGAVLLDTFVQVPDRVTDFRTFVSGVRAKDIRATNDDAMELHDCRRRVGSMLKDKTLVGHALKNDLTALMLDHPRADIRDTARHRPFMRPSGRGGGKMRPRKLRDLVKEHLGLEIQVEGEEHCSIDDARATMQLFQFVKDDWDKELYKKDGGKSKMRGKKRL